MKPASSLDALRQQTADALSRQPAWPAVAAVRPARAGDLLMVTDSDTRPDFWLVTELSSSPVERLRLVPADIDPICGASDVVLPDDEATGALTARCAFAVWLDADAVRPLARAGSVADESLEKVRQLLTALDGGQETGTELDRDTEAELEYRDLVAELTDARDQLIASAGGSRSQGPRTETAPPPARRFTGSSALAASVLLSLSLGLVMGWMGRDLWLKGPSSPPAPLVDVPFEWLSPGGQIRNQAGDSVREITLDPGMPYIALFLDVGVGGATEYRLEIRREGALEPWWSGKARRTGAAEIFVLLPTEGLEPGEYSLEVYSDGDSAAPRFVYPLRFERPSGP